VFDWWHTFFGLCHGAISSFIKIAYKNRILFISENVFSREANKVDTILTIIGLRNASMLLTLSKSVEEEVGRFVYDRKIYRSELPRYDYYQSNHKEKIQAFNSKLGIGKMTRHYCLGFILQRTLFEMSSQNVLRSRQTH